MPKKILDSRIFSEILPPLDVSIYTGGEVVTLSRESRPIRNEFPYSKRGGEAKREPEPDEMEPCTLRETG